MSLQTPWTVAHQVPLSMRFSRQEYSSQELSPYRILSQGSSRPRDQTRLPTPYILWSFSLLHKSSSLPPSSLHPVYPAQKGCPRRGHPSPPEDRTFVSRSCSLSFLLLYFSLSISVSFSFSLSLSVSLFFLSLPLFRSPSVYLFLSVFSLSVSPCFSSLSLCISSRVPLSFPQYLYICLLCSLSLCYQFLTISYTKDSLNTTGSGGGDGERRNNSLLQSGTEAHEPMRDHMFPLKALF